MQRLVRSFRTRGVLGTIRHAVVRLMPGHKKRLARRAAERVRTREEAARAFDGDHGVETGGYIRPADLSFDASRRLHAIGYEAILPHEFQSMMRAAGPIAAGRTFVDLGCGKGRALLLAATYPFSRVLGVELADDLAELARRNVASYRGDALACRRVDVVVGDATEFEFPDGALVVFLFNPFDETVLAKVIENLERAMEREARAVSVLYANSRQAALFDRVPFAKRVVRGRPTVDGDAGYKHWSIYHFDPVQAPTGG